MGDREGLIARIRQTRRAAATVDRKARPTTASADHVRALETRIEHGEQLMQALEARVEHGERLVQALQDSVHRESSRHAKQIAALEAQIQPAALGKALSDDARARGL